MNSMVLVTSVLRCDGMHKVYVNSKYLEDDEA